MATQGLFNYKLPPSATMPDIIASFNGLVNEFNRQIAVAKLDQQTGHLVLNPTAASRVVKLADTFLNDTTTTYEKNVIIQHGITAGTTIASGGDIAPTVTFPLSFDTTNYSVVAVVSGGTGVPSGGSQINAIVDNKTTTGCTLRAHNSGGGTTGTVYIEWFAIGVYTTT